jgi:putative flippase GtrA
LFRFILVGGLNTLVGMSVIFILLYLGVNNYISNLSGYIVGLIISFFLHKYYTFESKNKPTIKEVIQFLLVFAISYSSNILILYFSLFYMENYLAQFLAMICYTASNYTLNKLITFK